MSLQRYINNESILSINIPQYGQLYSNHQLQLLNSETFIPLVNFNINSLISELHIYTFTGNYLGSTFNSNLDFDNESKNILVDVRQLFRSANIVKGSYKLVANLIYPVFGAPSYDDIENINWPVFVKEIAPEKDEIALTLSNISHKLSLIQFKDYANQLLAIDQLNNLVVNFGNNKIYKIVNIKSDLNDPSVFYIKIHGKLDGDINELDRAWFGIEVMDSYIDTVILTSKVYEGPTNQLKGPRFHMDVDDYNSQATIYQSWNDLLDTNGDTGQRIIDGIISGSGYATLNIDYTDYNNFIFYSSAAERLSNFKEKMSMIEGYKNKIRTLEISSGSNTSYVISNVASNKNRISNLETNLDPFERWLYHHSTGSLFTHDISGSLTPWPKYISGSQYHNHHVTSSIAQGWYNGNLLSASAYDQRNVNSLWWSIPEHILMNDGNSEYVMFVNMIGHHFDTLYSYVHALTEIHNKDEHPERGAPNQLLGHIAKSFGWNLQNTRQLSSLWLYKLGTNDSGSFITSSGMDVIPHEQQTQQIWKRIVNNLPYLLKTKGSSRSVKALMSIYGIPHTLLSIKEYGGPSLDVTRPIAIEDYYAYKLIVSGNAHVKIPRDTYAAKYYGWGDGKWCGGPISSSVATREADTVEFRFAIPDFNTGSVGAGGYSGSRLLYAAQFSSSHATTPNQFIYAMSVTPSNLLGTSSISGSTLYGKLNFESFTSQSVIYSGSSEYLPLFDGDLWTVRITNKDPFRSDSSRPYGPLRIDISKASDCLYGRPTFSSSFEVGTGHSILGNGHSYLGGMPSASLANINVSSSIDYANYTIHYQAYKEYFTIYSEDTFYTHVLNPRAYNTDSISGSFYSLYRYYPLGLDEQRWDHVTSSQYQFLSSSHPDRDIVHNPAQFVGFTGSQTTQYESLYETAYIKIPSLGGNVLYGEKIRLEDSKLTYELSPDAHATISENDNQTIDSNRLAIVFSLADHVNRDIYNHMGPANLDSWIGDPEYEFSSSYSMLEIKRNEYYQKYEQKNDINSFIRILSLFDYTFFEQIKQLVPARADLITGILIEPTILERSKIKLSNRPTIESPSYEDVIDLNITSQSGEFPYYEKELIVTASLEATYNYYKTNISSSFTATASYDTYRGLISGSFIISSSYNYHTASIRDPFIIASSLVFKTTSGSYCGQIPVTNDPYVGVTGSQELYVSESVISCVYKKKICYFDAYLIRDSLTVNPVFDNLDNWWTGSGISLINETRSFVNIETYKLDNYAHLSGSTNNPAQISQSISTVPGREYLIRYYARPYILTDQLTASTTIGSSIMYNPISLATSSYGQWVKEYRIPFTGSGTDNIIIGTSGSLVIYSYELYEYLTPYHEQWRKLAYKELRMPSSCIEIDWNYQFNECSVQNRNRFEGSKISGAGFNIDSSETPDGGPVVVITEVNPNTSIMGNQGDNDGNIRLK